MRLPHCAALAMLAATPMVAMTARATVPAQTVSRQEAKRAARREIYAILAALAKANPASWLTDRFMADSKDEFFIQPLAERDRDVETVS